MANPKGHKPDKLMRDALSVVLHRAAEDADGKPTKRLNNVAAQLVKKAESGDVAAIKEIFDRMDGKVALGVDANMSGAMTVNVSLNAVD